MPRTGIMLCQPLEEKRLNKWQPPYIVQPKLDGERCRAVWNVEGHKLERPILWSSEENIFNTVPHIQKAIEKLNRPDLELDGELYMPNSNFNEIHSRVSTTRLTLHTNHEEIGYYIFDIVDETLPQTNRLVILKGLNLKPPLFLVSSFLCDSLQQIMEQMKHFNKIGYEGIIVRHILNLYVRKRSSMVMKFKPKCNDTYTIIGWKQEVDKNGELKNSLGALICCGKDGNIFSVGSGLTQDLRAQLWNQRDNLDGKSCFIQYQHLTPGKQVPRFPVFISII